MKVSVNAPSWRRPKVETLDYLPFLRVWVDPSEAAQYRKANPGAEIIECAKGVQGNISRVRNHILDREFDRGMDAVAIVDDDMRGMFYFEGARKHGKDNDHLVPGDRFVAFVKKYTLLAQDLGVKMWGVNVTFDPQYYQEYKPFALTCYIGSPFTCFLRGNACRYDEALPLKEDYDMTLQQLNRYRKVLRLNKFHYMVKQGVQAGGCSVYRSHEVEREQLEALRKKWGSRIVRIDHNERNHIMRTGRVREDYNPVIVAPIAGA